MSDDEDTFDIRVLGEPTYPSPIDSNRLRDFFLDDDDRVYLTCLSKGGDRDGKTIERAGPRPKIFFDPSEATAAIITCGGLCPGLNDVIRALFMCLYHCYGVQRVLGCRFGYAGLTPTGAPPIILTPAIVRDIHKSGGCMLGTSRGPQSSAVMAQFLVDNKVDMLFCIGGDGTMKGALSLSKQLRKQKANVVVIGVPKTIDNDILYTDKTFGFDTAVAEAQRAIISAHNEATSHENGIGVVKLMGRESGYIATYSSLASGVTNLTLLPEIDFSFQQVLGYVEERLRTRGHILIVVAEGAGQDSLCVSDESKTDKSGNIVLQDVGVVLCDKLKTALNGKGIEHTIKYIDPSYQIRSCVTNSNDSVFCVALAHAAVHAAMSGRTELVISHKNGQYVHIPMAKTVTSRRKVDPNGLLYGLLLSSTGMPHFTQQPTTTTTASSSSSSS